MGGPLSLSDVAETIASVFWRPRTAFVAPQGTEVRSTRLKTKGQRIMSLHFLVFFRFSFLPSPLSYLCLPANPGRVTA